MRRGRVHLLGLIVTVLLMGGVAAIATLTVTTRQGVNFHVSSRKISLSVKVLDFLYRHHQYAILVGEITSGRTSDPERALTVLDWTRRNIRPTPDGWPIVDDHVLNVIIRGHGTPDQMADVFAVLSTYAGVPAFWETRRISPTKKALLTFVRIEGEWMLVDVPGGGGFTPARGPLVPAVPATLRAELQMPWPRLRYEALRTFGWMSDDEP